MALKYKYYRKSSFIVFVQLLHRLIFRGWQRNVKKNNSKKKSIKRTHTKNEREKNNNNKQNRIHFSISDRIMDEIRRETICLWMALHRPMRDTLRTAREKKYYARRE